ncbi:MAG TPA: indole-3-glycerol phosphate synthase TrpC [Acidobacteriota bacterium]|nr:indole-3-glycerol phosphate synthase TrpC [Acidobacteriota bacterium]
MITLDRLVETARQKAAVDRATTPQAELRAKLRDSDALHRPGGRLRRALQSDGMSVIAEIKAASPLAGPLRTPFDPVDLARQYVGAGAAAISVLTEETFFAGSLAHLGSVAAAVELPVLRKDFIIDAYQIEQAALAGAAAVLLIAEALEPSQLRDLVGIAHQMRLDALVELHDADSIDAVVEADSGLIGINNRDLRSMRVDWRHSLHVAEQLPAGTIRVSESGIQAATELHQLEAAGYHAVLVGTSLVRATDPATALRRLLVGEA